MCPCMFFYLVYVSIWRSTLLIFWFSAWPFLVSIGKAAPPPFCILPILARLDFYPLLFILTRCISKPWIPDFSVFSAMSALGNHSRYPLQSWGSFSLWMFPTFLEESTKWSENFLNAPVRSVVSVQSYLFGCFRSCRRVLEGITARLAVFLSGGSRLSWSSSWFSGDIRCSWRDWFALVSISQEVFSRTSLLFVSWILTKKVSNWPLPFSLTGLWV